MRFQRVPVEVDAVLFTGKNARDVRDWADRLNPADVYNNAWFVTKAQCAPTGMQAWHYIKDGACWGPEVVAAVYNYRLHEWLPVTAQQWVVHEGGGDFYAVPDDGDREQQPYGFRPAGVSAS